jgi:pSer/pThr/pTyr-binding forkhead associated (FHA) protein
MATQIVLKVLVGREAGRQIVVSDQSLCTIGRSRSCTLRLADDATVSRQHCMLEVEGPLVKVCDLGSKNGTFVNGVLVGQRPASTEHDTTLSDNDPYLLRHGDQLVVGQNLFEVGIVLTPPGGYPLQDGKVLLAGGMLHNV